MVLDVCALQYTYAVFVYQMASLHCNIALFQLIHSLLRVLFQCRIPSMCCKCFDILSLFYTLLLSSLGVVRF